MAMELKIVREFSTAKRFDVPDEVKKKYPKGHFHWGRVDANGRIDQHVGNGSIPAEGKEGAQVRVGDLMLMVCHEDTQKNREAAKKAESARRFETNKEIAKGNIEAVDKRLGYKEEIESK